MPMTPAPGLLVLCRDVKHLARLHSSYRLPQCFGYRLIVFAAVAGGVHDDDANGQFLGVVLELEAAVEREKTSKFPWAS